MTIQLSSSSAGENAATGAGFLQSTASTRNGELRNHGDAAGVSTTRDSSGVPL
jgi:hypothetical protein